ncbi:MAG: hypothetical protein EXR87_03745 [Gammaproteobacteria bacterium]|nr:hypothetical protein [Gammaproteobacteria bacterium]
MYIDYIGVEKPNEGRATASPPSTGANVIVLSADPVPSTCCAIHLPAIIVSGAPMMRLTRPT